MDGLDEVPDARRDVTAVTPVPSVAGIGPA